MVVCGKMCGIMIFFFFKQKTAYEMRISDWSSDVCSSDLPSAARFKAFYRRSFIPDEAFFQTLMMNSAAHGEVMNDDLRTIDWVPDGEFKLRPRTFVAADALRLTLSTELFARKFDEEEDSAIFDLLEAHLKKPEENV